MSVIFVLFVFFHSFLWLSFKTYCDQSQNRQDVVEGIPENSPPGQYHHLRRYKSVGFTGSSVLSQISPQWVFNSFVRLNQIIMTHLSSKEPTDTNDAEDVEDGRAHDGSHPHITVGDENTCAQGISQSESTVTPAIWAGGWVGGYLWLCVCVYL